MTRATLTVALALLAVHVAAAIASAATDQGYADLRVIVYRPNTRPEIASVVRYSGAAWKELPVGTSRWSYVYIDGRKIRVTVTATEVLPMTTTTNGEPTQ